MFAALQVSETSLTVGAAVSISDLITALQTNANKSPNFEPLAEHLQKIANTPVRNRGTWAGNIMMAHDHDDFPSDVFLLFSTSNATLTTGSYLQIPSSYHHLSIYYLTAYIRDLSTYSHTCWEMLKLDMPSSVRMQLPLKVSSFFFF